MVETWSPIGLVLSIWTRSGVYMSGRRGDYGFGVPSRSGSAFYIPNNQLDPVFSNVFLD